MPKLGDVLTLRIERVGAEGVCIAHHEGQVVFVRFGIPGELVEAEVTEGKKSYLRATVTRVVEASPNRVDPPCSVAGVCGGCDWQHLLLTQQRIDKAELVHAQLRHLAGVHEIAGKPLAQFACQGLGDADGLRWRTRNRFAVIAPGEVGLRMARSHSIVELSDCLIAVDGAVAIAQRAAKSGEVRTAQSSTGEQVAVDETGGPWLTERVAGREWRIHAGSFWQAHSGAADRYTQTVRKFAQVRLGESLLDLYSGAGLFAGALAADVGPDGSVVAVENNIDSMRDARRSLSDLGQVELITARTQDWLVQNDERFDVIVLDPPRAGAGAQVMANVANRANRAIIYVACDAASLGRDVGLLRQLDWELVDLAIFDAFPMTAHVEAIALLEPKVS